MPQIVKKQFNSWQKTQKEQLAFDEPVAVPFGLFV
jgi:hypothetical protein